MQPRGQTSIKQKIVLSTLVLSLLSLLGIGLGVRSWNVTTANDKMDSYLIDEAVTAAAAITDVIPVTVASNPLAIAASRRGVIDYLSSRVNLPKVYKTSMVVYDANEEFVGESNNAIPLSTIHNTRSEASYQDARVVDGNTNLYTVTYRDQIFRAASLGVFAGGLRVAQIQVASLLNPIQRNILDFDRLLIVTFCGAGLINFLGLLVIMARTLRPIDGMRLVAESINGPTLNSRLPVPPGNDEISRLALTFNKMLARVEEAYRFQLQLVHDLSHQLRTPLAVLRGSNEIALQGDRTADELRSVLENNLSDIDRMSAFLATMLNLARLESNATKINQTNCDLIAFVVDLVKEMRPLWDDRDISVIVELLEPDNPPLSLYPGNNGLPGDNFPWRFVRLDQRLMSHAFMNILSNAYKFCAEPGVVKITLTPPPLEHNLIAITFWNNGPSIPEEAKELVFERFVQIPPIEKSSRSQANVGSWAGAEGFGLGLSFTRLIVGLHHGTIRTYTPADGGAAFEVLLPITD